MTESVPRPLENIRIIDMGSVITGPLTASLLAELGAEVFKIERPDGGDPFRSFLGGLYSPQFRAYNKNKKSIALDLREDDAKSALAELLRDADVLVENFRPGVMDRLGFSEKRLKELNPQLVHCSITGFGSVGPYAARAAYDGVAQALAGIAGMFMDPERPRFRGPTIADNVTGMYAALGILAALVSRNEIGRGRRVEVNMLEASIAFIPDSFAYTEEGLEVSPYTRVAVSQTFALACADDKQLAIHLSSQPKFWEAMLEAIDRTELADDPRFTTRKDRYQNYLQLLELLEEIFRTRTRSEWMERLDRHDVPFAPIQTLDEVPQDPQVAHLGTFYSQKTEGGDTVRAIHCPIMIDGMRVAPQSAPPQLGQHTALIETLRNSKKATKSSMKGTGQ